MTSTKTEFLQRHFLSLLQQTPADTPPAWGKMTLQQMIEHFADAVRIASGRTPHTEVLTPDDQLDKARAFLLSEKPFRENTPNPFMPEVPAPVRNPSKEEALKELKAELTYFFSVFEQNKLGVTRNPFFGDLTYEQNVHLLHKHALHHLKQFGVNV